MGVRSGDVESDPSGGRDPQEHVHGKGINNGRHQHRIRYCIVRASIASRGHTTDGAGHGLDEIEEVVGERGIGEDERPVLDLVGSV